jgi:hypothetical protein
MKFAVPFIEKINFRKKVCEGWRYAENQLLESEVRLLIGDINSDV